MFNSAINIIILGIIFFLVFLRLKAIKNHTFLGRNFIYLFTVEHFSVTFVFAFFLDRFTTINDPQRFYEIAQNSSSWFQLFGFGNSFMSFLTYPLIKLGLTIQSCFFIFSFLGWLGFIKLFKLLEIKKIERIHLYHIFFFLPTIHLWTSSLSKEPLLIFFIAIIIDFCYKKEKQKMISFGISFFMILLIRPHVFVVMFFLYITIFHFKVKKINRKLIFLLSFSCLFLAFLLIKFFLKIDFNSIDLMVEDLILRFEKESLLGNSSISIIETNIFQRIWYLLFMPLPVLYQAQSVFQFLASLENLYYVLVFFYLIVQIFRLQKLVTTYNFDSLFSLMNFIVMTFLFASYLYNLGLGNRMRIMIYPFFFYFLINNLNKNRKKIKPLNNK